MSEAAPHDTKETYVKWYARDFALGTFQVWYWGEATDAMQWTPKTLPYPPYIVFHRAGDTTHIYYGDRGVAWVFDQILAAAQPDAQGFVQKISDEYRARIGKVKSQIETEPALPLPQLKQYVACVRDAWAWFNALWYAIDTFDEMPKYAKELAFLTEVRKETERQVPATDTIIRKSIHAAYPNVGAYADCVLLEEAFENRIPDTDTLVARRKGYYFTDGRLFSDSPESRKEIEERFNIFIKEPDTPKVDSTLTGTVACRGKAAGKVRKIYGVQQIHDFLEGEILVAASTIPDFLPALKKAAAIVSDEGGAVCHAAITARELKTPCIVGVRFAMDLLKDGDWVEVDADKGVVRILHAPTP